MLANGLDIRVNGSLGALAHIVRGRRERGGLSLASQTCSRKPDGDQKSAPS
jgi:hypothetical protein